MEFYFSHYTAFWKKATVTRLKSDSAIEKRFLSELTDIIKGFKETYDRIQDMKDSITDWTDDAKCFIGCLEKTGFTSKVTCAALCHYKP